MTGVALLFIFTYSTIGKIETSRANHLYMVSSSVDFSDGILNAPTFSSGNQYEQSDVSIPDYSPENVNYETRSITTIESRYANHVSNNASNTASSSSNNNVSSSSSEMAGAIIASNSKGSSASQTASTGQMENVSSLTTDGSLSSNTNRQGANAANNSITNGGRDPGGKNPHNSIPVGDGLGVLLILASIYAIWKSKIPYKKKRKNLYRLSAYNVD